MKTKVSREVDPEWHETVVIPVKSTPELPLSLLIEVFKKKMNGSKSMGQVEIPLARLVEDDLQESFALQPTGGEEVAGEMMLFASYASETRPRKIKIERTWEEKVESLVTSRLEEGEYSLGVPEGDAVDAEWQSLEKVVEKITKGGKEQSLADSLLVAHRSFCSSVDLCRLLVDRFRGPPEGQKVSEEQVEEYTRNKKIIQAIVASMFERWFVLSEDLLETKVCKLLMKSLEARIFDQDQALKTFLRDVCSISVQAPQEAKNLTENIRFYNFPLLSKYSTGTIAEQLTLIERDNLCRVKFCELVGQQWTKSPGECPNISRVIQWFNRVSGFVCTEVVRPSEPEERAVVVGKFIEIGKRMRQLNNFGGVMEILSGLHNASISRLKKTWALVKSEQKECLEELSELMSSKKNFKRYREEIIKLKSPWLPYLGVHLTDLTYIDETYPTFNKAFNKLLYLPKLKILEKNLKLILSGASVPFQGLKASSTVQQILVSVEVMDEKQLYRLSLSHERRSSQEIDVAPKSEKRRSWSIAKLTRKSASLANPLSGDGLASKEDSIASKEESLSPRKESPSSRKDKRRSWSIKLNRKSATLANPLSRESVGPRMTENNVIIASPDTLDSKKSLEAIQEEN